MTDSHLLMHSLAFANQQEPESGKVQLTWIFDLACLLQNYFQLSINARQ